MLTIDGLSDKECFWCQGTKDTVQVSLNDGSFNGTLCKNDLFRLLRSRSKNGKPDKPGVAGTLGKKVQTP